jgi:hypothetical protein
MQNQFDPCSFVHSITGAELTGRNSFDDYCFGLLHWMPLALYSLSSEIIVVLPSFAVLCWPSLNAKVYRFVTSC